MPTRRELRREEWERMRSQGRTRFLVRHGVLQRGLPMAIVTALLLQAAEGNLDMDALRSATFHARFLLAFAVFSIGGALSAYVNWKALEKRLGDRQPPP